jgi:hypothetical protein
VAGPRLKPPPAPAPLAQPAVEAYLAALATGLPGPRRARQAILAEVSDGIAESIDAHVSAGLDDRAATRTALATFGEPRHLSAAFANELAGATAYRVGLALVMTGPLIGLAWLTAFALNSGRQSGQEFDTLMSWLPAYGLPMFAVVLAAVLATAGGVGPVARYLPLGPRRAAASAVAAAVGCVIVDTILLTHLARMTAAGELPPGLALVPALLSLVRLALAVMAALRCAVLHGAARPA